ncbi:TIGR02281 family clan AA aspartic protease [Pseudomonadota bacterium]|nr:TIGR02281 family clan AA aspartic protease [Pseudomonadota bacterium]
MIKRWIIGLIILLNASYAWSDVLNIMVVGLFRDHAVLVVDHVQRSLKVGEQSPEGITLISASSHGAVLEKNGIEKDYLLGTQISADYSPPVAQTVVSLWPTNGMYITTGSVNGYSVDFLVDTGASAIALNVATADRLGIDFRKGNKFGVKTASGFDTAYDITLDSVQIGDIKLYNIRAMVLDGAEPERALLGMTFLNQIEIQRKDQRMDLKKKF